MSYTLVLEIRPLSSQWEASYLAFGCSFERVTGGERMFAVVDSYFAWIVFWNLKTRFMCKSQNVVGGLWK